jgi:hypothetical protein
MIGGVVAAAVILVVGLILLGNRSSSEQAAGNVPGFDFSNFPHKGSDQAPVTFVDFSNYG